jgi:hypothetical protein
MCLLGRIEDLEWLPAGYAVDPLTGDVATPHEEHRVDLVDVARVVVDEEVGLPTRSTY